MRVLLLRQPMKMDNHYASQMASTLQGPTRQFGSGAGIGAFALRVGRTAMPLLKKYVGPFVKQVGQNVLEAALPEVVSLIQGKKKFKGAVEDGTNKALAKTGATAGGALAGGRAAEGRQAPEKGSSIQMVLVFRRVAADLPPPRTKSFLTKRSQREVGLTFWPS